MSRVPSNPLSFKTVPGRNRTQKWNQAKTHTYDGDDWGGYDPYDEFDQEEPPLPQPPSSIQVTASRARSDSFQRGDEHRAFSTSTAASSDFAQSGGQHMLQTSGPYFQHVAEASQPHPGRLSREFSHPEHIPAPLSTRTSPAPPDRFPRRKSSLTGSSPLDAETAASSFAASNAKSLADDKPLPFIRPSDIYKRIPEERERQRQSEDSTRPSMDSIRREIDAAGTSVQTAVSGMLGSSLTPVAEIRESRLFPEDSLDANMHAAPVATEQHSRNVELHHQPSQGIRSAVQRAFEPSDDSTSLSRDSSQSQSGPVSGVTRSQSNSTSDISPIMSRVPSAVTAQSSTQHNTGQFTPIAEEASSTSRPASGSYTLGPSQISRKPSPSQIQSAGVETVSSGFGRGSVLPASENSPAHQPVMESVDSRRLSGPMSAVHLSADTDQHGGQLVQEPVSLEGEASALNQMTSQMSSASGRRGTDYSMRESDLANEVNAAESDDFTAEVAAAQRSEQQAFLRDHSSTPRIAKFGVIGANISSRSVTPVGSGRDSPSKSRVREIADQYQDIHNASRRNSATSVGSLKPDFGSLGNPRLADTRPNLEREESFKPDLPGGWISPAPTPASEGQILGTEGVERNVRTPVDLTPTTAKVPLREISSPEFSDLKPASTSESGSALEAVRKAGESLGASLLASAGLGHQTHDFASAEPAQGQDLSEAQPRPVRGSMPPQPLSWLTRQDTDSTEGQSIAPSVVTTPGIDAGERESSGTIAPLRFGPRDGTAQTSESLIREQSFAAQSPSSDLAVGEDPENDRLRKEIVQSLDSSERRGEVAGLRNNSNPSMLVQHDESGGKSLPSAAIPSNVTASRPGPLGKRFSWENKSETQPSQPQTQIPEPTPQPPSPEIKPEMAYERPRNKELHVMNASTDDMESPVEERKQIAGSSSRGKDLSEISPIFEGNSVRSASMETSALKDDQGIDDTGSLEQPLRDMLPSPISEPAESILSDVNSAHLPAYHLNDRPMPPEKDLPVTGQGENARQAALPRDQQSNAPIPPFRTIFAMKSPAERITTYNETRKRFADMNTGLDDWLQHMISLNPENADLDSSIANTSSGTVRRPNHRPSPSMIRFTKPFGSGAAANPEIMSTTAGERSNDSSEALSNTGATSSAGVSTNPGGAGLDDSNRLHIDREKMQQRGKDLMKSAGVLGGKAQAGAKGLLAKGRSRFGGVGGSRRDVSGTKDDKAPMTTAHASSLSATPLSNSPSSQRTRGIPTPAPQNIALPFRPTTPHSRTNPSDQTRTSTITSTDVPATPLPPYSSHAHQRVTSPSPPPPPSKSPRPLSQTFVQGLRGLRARSKSRGRKASLPLGAGAETTEGTAAGVAITEADMASAQGGQQPEARAASIVAEDTTVSPQHDRRQEHKSDNRAPGLPNTQKDASAEPKTTEVAERELLLDAEPHDTRESLASHDAAALQPLQENSERQPRDGPASTVPIVPDEDLAGSAREAQNLTPFKNKDKTTDDTAPADIFQRRTSDLATLPSQRRASRRIDALGDPLRITTGHINTGENIHQHESQLATEDDLYTASKPAASVSMRSVSVYSRAHTNARSSHAGDDDEDYQTKSILGDDEFSTGVETSPQQVFSDARAYMSVSRRTSVSSLSPTDVTGGRATPRPLSTSRDLPHDTHADWHRETSDSRGPVTQEVDGAPRPHSNISQIQSNDAEVSNVALTHAKATIASSSTTFVEELDPPTAPVVPPRSPRRLSPANLMLSDDNIDYQQRFANRTYRSSRLSSAVESNMRTSDPETLMSYSAVPGHYDGDAPMLEIRNTIATAQPGATVDLSLLGGQPTTSLSSTPAFRNAADSTAPTSTPRHLENEFVMANSQRPMEGASIDAGGDGRRKSRRSSLFRGRQQRDSLDRAELPQIVSASAITDAYGLEDIIPMNTMPVETTEQQQNSQPRANRRSGFWSAFRAPTPVSSPAQALQQSPNRRSGAWDTGTPSTSSTAAGPSQSHQPASQRQRPRSGVWDALNLRRFSSSGTVHESVSPGPPPVPQLPTTGQKVNAVNTPTLTAASSASPNNVAATKESAPGKGKLQKPRRTASAAVATAAPPVVETKRRSSVLGSLFGRSGTPGPSAANANTNANSTSKEKQNRLTKKAPATSHSTQQPGGLSRGTVTGNVRNYEAYEALRRRDLPDFQVSRGTPERNLQEGRDSRLGNNGRRVVSGPGSRTSSPPRAGWFAPQIPQEYTSPQPPPPYVSASPSALQGQARPQHIRRAFSEGSNRQISREDLAEESRQPNNAYQSMIGASNSNPENGYRDPSMQMFNDATGSNGPEQFLNQQQSRYYKQHAQPLTSNPLSRQYPPQRPATLRFDSEGSLRTSENLGSNPNPQGFSNDRNNGIALQQDPAMQQSPWRITLPSREPNRRLPWSDPSDPEWPMQAHPPSTSPQPANLYRNLPGPAQHDQPTFPTYPQAAPGGNPNGWNPRPSPNWIAPSPSPPSAYIHTRSSPPPPPTLPDPHSQPILPAPTPPPQPMHYYQPSSQQRRRRSSSGYTPRANTPALIEEDEPPLPPLPQSFHARGFPHAPTDQPVFMRATSYPGQEWMPAPDAVMDEERVRRR